MRDMLEAEGFGCQMVQVRRPALLKVMVEGVVAYNKSLLRRVPAQKELAEMVKRALSSVG